MQLIKYNAACTALAEAKSADEAKDWRDKAEAMRAYAHQAKNRQLEIDATEIRFRAERRLGELIKAQKDTVGLAKGTRGQLSGRNSSGGQNVLPPEEAAPTLESAGIDKNLSSHAQKVASIPEEEFEGIVGEWRQALEYENKRVTTNILKAANKAESTEKNPKVEKPEVIIPDELAKLREENEGLREANAEQGKIIKEMLEELESYGKVVDSGDQLTAAIAEAKKFREMNRILESRIVGLMNEKNEAVRLAKSWKRQADKNAS